MSDQIEIDPGICGDQPVIKGALISVPAILEQLASGESWDSILGGYRELKRADVEAALDYAPQGVLHTEFTVLDSGAMAS